MRVVEPGHIYDLESQDGGEPIRLTFVNRETDAEHPGTLTQEVLRALIDRTMHCDNCLRWEGNNLVIHHLRMALALHEARTLVRKTFKGLIDPENLDVDPSDGHFLLSDPGPQSLDAKQYDPTKPSEGGLGIE